MCMISVVNLSYLLGVGCLGCVVFRLKFLVLTLVVVSLGGGICLLLTAKSSLAA